MVIWRVMMDRQRFLKKNKMGGFKMTRYTVNLSPETARFYEMVAQTAGRSTEQVLSDALFKLAGELSLEALHKKGKRQGR